MEESSRRRGKVKGRQLLAAVIGLLLVSMASSAYSQQFNSDNWWVLPRNTMMGLASIGEDHSVMYLGYGFAPGWEIDAAPTIYKENLASGSAARYSTTVYVKRLIWQNKKETAGASVMAGVGQAPGYYQSGIKTEDFKSYWASFPITVPFLGNRISWDIMPGFSYNREYGVKKDTATGFTYSSRVAVYKIIPQSAIVGEVFGAAGEAKADAEYKVGVRWESKPVVVAVTYGGGLQGNRGAGWELGVMFFGTPWK